VVVLCKSTTIKYDFNQEIFVYMKLIVKAIKLCFRWFDIALMRYKTYSGLADENRHLHRLMQLDLCELSNEFITFIMRNCRNSYSQLYQDLFVLYFTEKYLLAPKGKNPIFIEFGACDGVLFSNTLLLEKNSWFGVVAEPAKKWHVELFKNRKCIISTKAVSSISGEDLLFLETRDPEFSSLYKNSQSDTFANYRQNNTVGSYKVKTVSLNDLISESGINDQITYLSLDTEGGEFDILQNFNFEKWSPAIITVEHNFTDAAIKLNLFLETKGYIRILETVSRFESWFVHSNQFQIPTDKIF
jgi:FkbM family methyltransferase